MMKQLEGDISIMVQMIETLQEPYRENIIHWLRSCSHKPMQDLKVEIRSFIDGLSSLEQEYFMRDMRVLLRKATRYFGVQGLRSAQPGRGQRRALHASALPQGLSGLRGALARPGPRPAIPRSVAVGADVAGQRPLGGGARYELLPGPPGRGLRGLSERRTRLAGPLRGFRHLPPSLVRCPHRALRGRRQPASRRPP